MARTAKAPRQGLRVRKIADHSDGRPRVKGFDRFTGQQILVNPETGEPDPYPCLGITIENPGGAPKKVAIPMSWVAARKGEGLVRLEGERITHAPGGPAEDPWRVTHTFVECDQIIIKGVEGDIVYEVTRQPGKDGEAGDQSAVVYWDYHADLVEG